MPKALAVAVLLAGTVSLTTAAEPNPPGGKPIPAVAVIPLPYDQSSFQHQSRELTRYHAAPTLRRPFWYPIAGPAGRSLTRMGHPHDPHTHSHHNSVWISHNNVGGVDFWADHGKGAGRIVQRFVKQYEDGDRSASMLSRNAWQDAQGKTLMNEWRRCTVEPLAGGDWLMIIDLEWESPPSGPVTLGQTAFGPIGVRMAKTIGVHDGGGRILNSAGQRGEEAIFRKPARWVDYSGPITSRDHAGIALMDHPANPNHPAPFHVRGDGWMGACLTFGGPITIEPGKPLRLRYGLWIHTGEATAESVEQHWRVFAHGKLTPLSPDAK